MQNSAIRQTNSQSREWAVRWQGNYIAYPSRCRRYAIKPHIKSGLDGFKAHALEGALRACLRPVFTGLHQTDLVAHIPNVQGGHPNTVLAAPCKTRVSVCRHGLIRGGCSLNQFHGC